MDVISFHERLQVSATPEMKQAIESAARRRSMSLSDYARSAIADSLARDGAAFPGLSLHTRTDRVAPPHVRSRAR